MRKDKYCVPGIHEFIICLSILSLCVIFLSQSTYTQNKPSNPTLCFAGCYHLILGPWSPTVSPPEASLSVTPPEYVKLESTPRSMGDGGRCPFRRDSYVISPAQGMNKDTLKEQFRVGSWSMEGQDAIRMEWSTGKVWVRINLTLSDDKLVGEAITGSDDLGSKMPKCSVEAVRIPCKKDH